jgi:hypothetical protein
MAAINLKRAEFHGEWNYTISPTDHPPNRALILGPKSGNELGDRIMILDTRSGDLWQWWDAPALGNFPAKTGITYMGKVTPGTAPGETRSFQRFDITPKKSN